MIASKVTFTVDFRHVDNTHLSLGAKAVTDLAEEVASSCDLILEITTLSASNAVKMDYSIIEQIKKSTNNLELNSYKLRSGPAHDAALIGERIPSGLIFIPSIEGLSHCFTENTNDSDLVNGVEVYRDVLQTLSMQL